MVTLMPSPPLTISMARCTSSRGSRWVMRSSTGTAPDAMRARASLLWSDLEEYRAWIEYHEARQLGDSEAAERWLSDVLEPALASLVPAIGPLRDPLQAYCDVLEEKWILSEMAGGDVGLEAAKDAYIGLGAPAPESGDAADGSDSTIVLDIDWSSGLEGVAPRSDEE